MAIEYPPDQHDLVKGPFVQEASATRVEVDEVAELEEATELATEELLTTTELLLEITDEVVEEALVDVLEVLTDDDVLAVDDVLVEEVLTLEEVFEVVVARRTIFPMRSSPHR